MKEDDSFKKFIVIIGLLCLTVCAAIGLVTVEIRDEIRHLNSSTLRMMTVPFPD